VSESTIPSRKRPPPPEGPQGRAAPSPQDFVGEVERRLTELEIKSTYADDLLERLNTMVFRQQEAIELLLREIVRLREQQQASGGESAFRSLRDELPPHY
jgi:SlyX protein